MEKHGILEKCVINIVHYCIIIMVWTGLLQMAKVVVAYCSVYIACLVRMTVFMYCVHIHMMPDLREEAVCKW